MHRTLDNFKNSARPIMRTGIRAESITLIGSTGSIGQQTLDVIRHHPKVFKVFALAADKNVELLWTQIREFKPKIVCVYNKIAAQKLKKTLKDQKEFSTGAPMVVTGNSGLDKISLDSRTSKIVFANSGLSALPILIKAIKAHKKIALATKEMIVTSGEKIMKLARLHQVTIVPIDSEHSAIFQCLQGENPDNIEKIILTCSGGPFYGKNSLNLHTVTAEEALQHPTWKMGQKISIDSATLFNKGFEMIEAKHLFQVRDDQLEILIHPESIVHSLVSFKDGSIKVQLGAPDMRIPITYALAWPQRINTNWPRLDFSTLQKLTFFKPDFSLLPGPLLVAQASRKSNAHLKKVVQTNSLAVKKFLEGKIKFGQIYDEIKQVMG